MKGWRAIWDRERVFGNVSFVPRSVPEHGGSLQNLPWCRRAQIQPNLSNSFKIYSNAVQPTGICVKKRKIKRTRFCLVQNCPFDLPTTLKVCKIYPVTPRTLQSLVNSWRQKEPEFISKFITIRECLGHVGTYYRGSFRFVITSSFHSHEAGVYLASWFFFFKKGKAVPLQAWSGPEGSRKLRYPGYMTTAQDGGKVVSLTHRSSLPPGDAPGTHFC
jgi:hypothetical protein